MHIENIVIHKNVGGNILKKNIYIFNSGTLKRKDNSIVLKTENETKLIPIEETSSIWVFGEIDFNKRILEFLATKNIVVHTYNHFGYYVSSIYPREFYNSGFVLLKQCEHYMDNQLRLNIAKNILIASFKSMEQNLSYYKSRKDISLTENIAKLQEIRNNMNNVNSVGELMGLEGTGRVEYYSSFNKILNNSDFTFNGRSKQPPKDAINALISFGNSLMYNLVLSEIYQTHLNPTIGYLHSTNQRSFTLNLDIAELFKPIIVDRIIFSLINKGIITINDFNSDFNSTLLNESGRKKFLKEFDSKINTTIKYNDFHKGVSYRRIIRLQIYHLQKHILEGEELNFFWSKW